MIDSGWETPMDPTEHQKLADALYEEHGRPLEADHYEDYLAVFPDGRTVLGATLIDVAQEAKAKFGQGAYLLRSAQRPLVSGAGLASRNRRFPV